MFEKKYDWRVRESSPRGYPMDLINGRLHYGHNDSVYIPTSAGLGEGWGEGISNHAVGERMKPLPRRLSVFFYSYLEDQFYMDEFELDKARIKALYDAGYPTYSERGQRSYHNFHVSFTPGGYVGVWLQGESTRTEVFFDKAEPVEVKDKRVLIKGKKFRTTFEDFRDAIIEGQLAKNEYVKQDIEEEITRLASHIKRFNETLALKGSVGRKLDFLCQEMHREVNTMSNKAVQTDLAEHTLQMKQFVEQIRQQVQNVE